MLSVEQALDAMLANVKTLGVEMVALADAAGRTLAADVAAREDAPPFANSAVDGYAARAAELAEAGADSPVVLPVSAEIHAGDAPTQTLANGTAARILTGAPVPEGADAIVMQEDARFEAGRVSIFDAPESGQHVRPAGEMWRVGDQILEAGTLLRAAEIGLLATLGRANIPVYRLPRVAVLSTGDELVGADADVLPPGKLRDSNRPMLAALVREAGCVLHSSTHVPDDLAQTEAILRELSHPDTGADVIITAGGVSVGDRDFIKPALETLGTLELWRVAMKPGKPLAYGQIGATQFFGLPGNPVSAYVTFELFARPLLWAMSGRRRDALARPTVRAVLTEAVSHTPGRREYLRAVTESDGVNFVTRTAGAQGSGLLRSVSRANSLLVVPEDAGDLAAGAVVTVLLLA